MNVNRVNNNGNKDCPCLRIFSVAKPKTKLYIFSSIVCVWKGISRALWLEIEKNRELRKTVRNAKSEEFVIEKSITPKDNGNILIIWNCSKGEQAKYDTFIKRILVKLMLTVGLEPTTVVGQILNLLCLPISPSKQGFCNENIHSSFD